MRLFETLYAVEMKYVGYIEKKSDANLDSMTANAGTANYTRFGRDYKKYTGLNFQAQPWCMIFQSVALVEAFGLSEAKAILGGALFASCKMCINSLQAKGLYTTNKSSVNAGDIVFFKDSKGSPCHVGWVYKTDSSYIYTIEGNTSAMVGSTESLVANGGVCAKKRYAKNSSKILGYGIIKYDEPKEGWIEENGKWHYYVNNITRKNMWIMSADKKDWYWVKANGDMADEEWIQDTKGNWYYIDKGGKAHRGWYQDKYKTWYYLNEKKNHYGEECQMVTGFVRINYKNIESVFYFEPNPKQALGACYINQIVSINNFWYKFDGDGRCVNPAGSKTKIN